MGEFRSATGTGGFTTRGDGKLYVWSQYEGSRQRKKFGLTSSQTPGRSLVLSVLGPQVRNGDRVLGIRGFHVYYALLKHLWCKISHMSM